MILYHFTRSECLDAILREGLLARNANPNNDQTNGKPVVWLTTRPSLVPSLKQRRRMLMREHCRRPPMLEPVGRDRLLKTTIPTTDRRLRHHLTWARKHLAERSQDILDPDYWFFLGDVRPRGSRSLKPSRRRRSTGSCAKFVSAGSTRA